MLTNEWALIVFTILTQMCAGSILVMSVLNFYAARHTNETEANRMIDSTLIPFIVALAIGLIASITHLGDPMGAPRAIDHLATSWLSREILLSVIFGVLGFVYVVLQWFKIGSASLRRALAFITAIEGLVMVFAQAKAYMLPVQPAWNTFATPVTFFATALLLGVLANGAALVGNYALVQRKYPGSAKLQGELLRGSIRWLAIASIVLAGVELVVAPVYMVTLATGSAAAQVSLSLVAGAYQLTYILRLALGFIGAAVLAAILYRMASNGAIKAVTSLAYGAFALVLVAEVMGRFLFYATSFKMGL
jgi:anaerobic dimethyl sulfoxide reductase subunit C (anchor subunit)